MLVITPLVILAAVVTLRLIPTRPLLAQAVWLTGLAAAITLAMVLFDQPLIGFLSRYCH